MLKMFVKHNKKSIIKIFYLNFMFHEVFLPELSSVKPYLEITLVCTSIEYGKKF